MFTVNEFKEYILQKDLISKCHGCGNDIVSSSFLGEEKRAIENKNGQLIASENIDDNLGLGIVQTQVDSNGKVVDIRAGATSVFIIRCNNCGCMRFFDANFVRREYKKTKTMIVDSNNN